MLKDYRMVDLTHVLTNQTKYWNGRNGFTLTTTLDYKHQSTEVKFRTQRLKMDAGIGTHIDAPAHCVLNGITVDQLSLDNLVAPCVVIDVSEKAHASYTITTHDLELFQAQYGTIAPKTFVIFRTGWEQWWNTPKKYNNEHRFPSLGKEAAKLLLTLDVVGIGIDTLSPDRPEDGFSVHHIILSSGKYIIENIANSSLLPHTGAYTIALPLRIGGATESAVRLIGLIKNN